MTDVRETLADHSRNALLVLGVALALLGAVGPGPVGAVTVLGLAFLLAAFLLDDAVASLLRSDDTAAEPAGDPVSELRERYVSGELDRAEFERRLDRLLDPADRHEARDDGRTGSRRETETLVESVGSSDGPERD